MTRSERRLLIDTSMLGVALTFLVVFLDFAGLLSAPERFFYDFRARHCQRYTPPPTTQLVHVDIDDKSLSELGHWPWPRSRLAEIVDEIRIGGAKTMVLDVILSEPNPYEIDQTLVMGAAMEQGATTRPTTAAATRPATQLAASQPVMRGGPTTGPADEAVVSLRLVDNDLMLAKALARFRAVVPVSLQLNAVPNNDRIYLAMVDELSTAPWTPKERLMVKLRARGFANEQMEWTVNTKYIFARD